MSFEFNAAIYAALDGHRVVKGAVVSGDERLLIVCAGEDEKHAYLNAEEALKMMRGAGVTKPYASFLRSMMPHDVFVELYSAYLASTEADLSKTMPKEAL
jgi:hypothetical protein